MTWGEDFEAQLAKLTPKGNVTKTLCIAKRYEYRMELSISRNIVIAPKGTKIRYMSMKKEGNVK